MIKAGIKEARQNLTDYLNMVQAGEEVIITKRGEPIARISPFKKKPLRKLASHKVLRDSIKAKGEPLSKTVIESRKEERY